MQRICDVIRDTSVPSWINSVPYNFGDAAAGVLKADEWRILATIYLPIALISIWGSNSSFISEDDAPTFREILDHTMLLVSAVSLACMRNMTPSRSQAYLECMSSYLHDLIRIHPHATYKPKHHMSMHLHFFFSLFGPVRSWWCFPFERLIGQIQRLLSNHKIGQMESTLLHSYLRAANLRRWLSDPNATPVFQEISDLFNKIYRARGSGDDVAAESPIDEENTKQSWAIPKDLSTLLPFAGRSIFLQARIKLSGTMYSVAKTHIRNSMILFYPNGNLVSKYVAESITYIFSCDRNRYLFAVQRQLPLDDDVVDPFCIYPYFPARLYSSQLSSSLECVETDWVFGHCARWKLNESHTVVLSLSRVSISFTCCNFTF